MKHWKVFIADFLLVALCIGQLAPLAIAATQVQTYDENGNITKDYNGNCYQYNEANRLKRITNCIGTIYAEYTYDFQGNRILSAETGNNYSYTPNKEYEHYRDYDNVGFLLWYGDTNYFYANNELVARKNNDGTYTYYHNDHLGSPNLQTNQAGAEVLRQEFTPFGRPESRAGSLAYNDKVQFTGQRENEPGQLNYMGSRYYSSSQRRFLQPDTMLPDPYDPQQLNRYAYVRNNPMKYNDPSGNIFFIPPALIAAGSLYSATLLSSPDFQQDSQFLALSVAEFNDNKTLGNAAAAGLDAAGFLLPAVPALGTTIKTAIKSSEQISEASRVITTLDDMVLDGIKTLPNNVRGWNLGDPINNLTKAGGIPSWNTIRSRLWKNEAFYNATKYTDKQLDRMQKGLAPLYFDLVEGKLLPFELHHNPEQRFGGLFDFEKVTKQEHIQKDYYRR